MSLTGVYCIKANLDTKQINWFCLLVWIQIWKKKLKTMITYSISFRQMGKPFQYTKYPPKVITRIMIYKSNWFLFSTRFKGGFFQFPVLVTLRSPLRPDQSSTRHSYGALRVGWTSTRQCLFFDNFSAFWSSSLPKLQIKPRIWQR